MPFARLASVTIEEPEDLRDMVWMPAQFRFENGGELVGLIPTRYPGSERSEDGLIVLARKTDWRQVADDTHYGLGQRILATDAIEVPLMELPLPGRPCRGRRRLRLNMAEQLTPQERLQPALLDRLTDDEPDKTQEPASTA